MLNDNHYIFNKRFDLIFIKFPIIFPLFYGIILYTLPQYENLLILLVLLILAEPHFGATWPFFLHKQNIPEIKNNKFIYIILPILIVIFSLIGFFYLNSLFFRIFFAINMFHVTRQSYGVCKLYTSDKEELNYQERLLYLINFVFFTIGMFRFYIPGIQETNILLVNIIVITSLLVTFTFYFMKFKKVENLLIFITGSIIFLPMCFVDKPLHGLLMGVTMHYTQYLALTYKIDIKRNLENSLEDKKKLNFFNIKNHIFLLIILIYGAAMTLLSNTLQLDGELIKSLIIIPLIGQMLHFYLDSQLWKFSNKHNREVTLKYLYF